MKVSAPLVASLACCVSAVSAQYFSEGWNPGHDASETREAVPVYTPGIEGQDAGKAEATASSPFSLTNLLTSGPVGSLLAKAGINVSESLSAASAAAIAELWDPRIPFITDDNYDDLVVNEPLTAEEENERTWFVVISTAAGQQQQGGVSKLVDQQFDAAFNTSLIENDLPSVRWARIDYLNVTYITTKWNIWRGPWLVVLRERGQSLRFYPANQARLNSTIMRNFLKDEGWRHTEPWSSSFAPGGSQEFILHYFAIALKHVYDALVRIPKFLLMILTGALGSLVMGFLHKPSKNTPAEQPTTKPKPAVSTKVQATPSKTSEAGTPSTPTSSKKGSGKKKGGKK